MSDASYRALPVRLGEASDSIATLVGAFPVEGVTVVEVREYDGGELSIVLDTAGSNWSWDERSIESAELWIYGTKRVSFDTNGSFLAKPQPLRRIVLGTDFEVEVPTGTVTGRLSHAVLRVS